LQNYEKLLTIHIRKLIFLRYIRLCEFNEVKPKTSTIMTQSIILQETQIAGKIYLIRGQRVILDADLAEFYGVHRTRNFNAFEWENRKPIGF